MKNRLKERGQRKPICPDWGSAVADGKGEYPVRVKAAFTLAEVLIAILIIGVVAALTLPALFRNISDRVNSTKVSVFNSKLVQALNSTKAAGELNNTYTDTYDFLKNGLSHHLKMTMICDNDNLKDCFNYDYITYEDNTGKEQTVAISSLKTAKKIKILDQNFSKTAAFVMADGTPVLLTYNTQCMTDGGADKTISPCVAGLFDINGSRKPNMFLNKVENGKGETKDIRSFNGASAAPCIGKINNMCIVNTIGDSTDKWHTSPTYDIMYNAILEIDPTYTRLTYIASNCSNNICNDNWQLSKDYCEKVAGGKLPTSAQLAEIATELYGTTIAARETKLGIKWSSNKNAIFAALEITDNTYGYVAFWSSDKRHSTGSYVRVNYANYGLSSGYGSYYYYTSNYANARVVCLSE